MNVVIYEAKNINITDDKGNDITQKMLDCVDIMHNIDGTVHISAADYESIQDAICKANTINKYKHKLSKSQLATLKRKQGVYKNHVMAAINAGHEYMVNIGVISGDNIADNPIEEISF